jgi:large-conductance mechanosensitive channel
MKHLYTYEASYTHGFTEQVDVVKLPHTYLGGTHVAEPLANLTHFCVLHPTLLVNARTVPQFSHGHFLQNFIHFIILPFKLFAASVLQMNE